MNIEVKNSANVCVIGTSQLMMFEEAYEDSVRQETDGHRFLEIESLRLRLFSAANSKYTFKAVDIGPDGCLRARTNALATAWELSAGGASTNLADYDAVVLFGFRGVGKSVYSRNEIMCGYARQGFSRAFLQELAVEAFKNNPACDLLRRLKEQGCSKRILMVPEPLYHKTHYSFCTLKQEEVLGDICQLIDDTYEQMCNDLGAVYLRQNPATVSEDGFTTRTEFLSQRHLFHISNLACPLILEDIRFNLGMVSKSLPVEL